ncbi:hypothetical protein KSX_53320 [Ktedonospora formicarum]|uniref:Uncharacterized protein n=1 Tax=Ktedonospora formicarum TaxID=2778364 RepID=A0A8J3I9K1_9CHLR|nr:hypothetical protein KSX_53320 [Ktedonospora formicarum]
MHAPVPGRMAGSVACQSKLLIKMVSIWHKEAHKQWVEVWSTQFQCECNRRKKGVSLSTQDLTSSPSSRASGFAPFRPDAHSLPSV